MNIFKHLKKVNYKYIFGELLLLFVGINLAIWFNNWNTSKKTNKAKETAIERIVVEIKNNQLEIDTVLKNNYGIINAYKEFKNIYAGNTSVVKTNPMHMHLLLSKFPDFFSIKDSTLLESGLYGYRGTTHINLEIPTLTEIAWKTTTTLNVTAEFNYDCLYELESVYNLQRRVQNEINKSADVLQKGDLEKLMIVLNFLNQLGSDLRSDYDAMNENIKNCS